MYYKETSVLSLPYQQQSVIISIHGFLKTRCENRCPQESASPARLAISATILIVLKHSFLFLLTLIQFQTVKLKFTFHLFFVHLRFMRISINFLVTRYLRLLKYHTCFEMFI